MKKLFAVLICLLMFTGCSALNMNTPTGKITNAGIDVAFVSQLQAHPEAKADVVAGLNNVKKFLTVTGCTYDELMVEVIKQFPQTSKYAIYAVVLSYYFECDKPISTTIFPLTDATIAEITVKLDRLISLAEII